MSRQIRVVKEGRKALKEEAVRQARTFSFASVRKLPPVFRRRALVSLTACLSLGILMLGSFPGGHAQGEAILQ